VLRMTGWERAGVDSEARRHRKLLLGEGLSEVPTTGTTTTRTIRVSSESGAGVLLKLDVTHWDAEVLDNVYKTETENLVAGSTDRTLCLLARTTGSSPDKTQALHRAGIHERKRKGYAKRSLYGSLILAIFCQHF